MNDKGTLKRLTSKGVFPYQWAFTLLLPLRNFILSPNELINRLGIKQNATVMELGPGPGYFSLPLAKYLKDGNLILADIQQEMIDYARRRLQKRKIHNVSYYLCNGMSFDFESESIDAIYMITVIGEVENKDDYFKEFYRMLKPDGILSITELAGDPDKMSAEEIIELAGEYQFRLLKQFGNKKNFTLNFSPVM